MDLFLKVLWLRERPWIGYAVAVLGSVPELWLRLAFAKELGGVTFVTFHPVILVASIIGGFGAGITAVLVSAALADFFILPPVQSALLPWVHGWVPLLSFVGSYFIIVALLALAMQTIIRLRNAEDELRAETASLEQQFAARTVLLQKAEEQLRQAQKMEAVGQLTGGLAHDFNNILAAIKGSIELMRRRISQQRYDELERYLTAAEEASNRAAAITSRLLTFSRRQPLDPRLTDIDRLIENMRELISRTVGPAIAVKVGKYPARLTALVDSNQLENALLNLCINAKDALPDGGRISIDTTRKFLDEEQASGLLLTSGAYILLSVRDNGCGMPPEIIERACDPFFTTKPPGQGTGLGLSMTYGFARQSGGNLRIVSQPGLGTAVTIFLPLAEQNSDQGILNTLDNGATISIASQPVFHKKSETVLVVDDEPDVRMLVVDTLEDMGYQVLEAEEGEAALKILRSRVHIDLLITDIGLTGGMNGRRLADAGREILPDLKVIFITGYAENMLNHRGQLEAGMQVLAKPFSIDILATRVQEVINLP